VEKVEPQAEDKKYSMKMRRADCHDDEQCCIYHAWLNRDNASRIISRIQLKIRVRRDQWFAKQLGQPTALEQ
jgi:hypothetical protein